MSRWRGLGIVIIAAGVLALGVALRPRQAPVQQTPTTSPVAALTTGSPEPVARQEPALGRAAASSISPEPAASTVASPLQESAASVPTSAASPGMIPADSPLPTTSVATIAAPAASVEPIVSPPTVIAAATQPAAPAASKSTPVTVIIKKDTVIGIRIDQSISTEWAHVDDKISARVSRDVVVDGTTAIPAGTRVEGVVKVIERPTLANPRGKLGIRFSSIVRPDNTRVAIATDTIFREASEPTEPSGASLDVNAFTAVVSGNRAAAPLQGRSGAASQSTPSTLVGSTGPSTSTASTRSSGSARPREAQLLAGTPLTLHLTSALSVTVNRDPQ